MLGARYGDDFPAIKNPPEMLVLLYWLREVCVHCCAGRGHLPVAKLPSLCSSAMLFAHIQASPARTGSIWEAHGLFWLLPPVV